MMERYLDGEVRLRRLAGVDAGATAALLCGAAFQSAFLNCFDDSVADLQHHETAERLVVALRLPSVPSRG